MRELLAASFGLELGKVYVVITLHLEVEELGVAGGDGGDEEHVEELEESANSILD